MHAHSNIASEVKVTYLATFLPFHGIARISWTAGGYLLNPIQRLLATKVFFFLMLKCSKPFLTTEYLKKVLISKANQVFSSSVHS